jgi:hypothetical protein
MSEELELRRRQNEQQKGERAAQAQAANVKRRRRHRIELAAFVLSAIAVAGVLYYDTTAVADDFFALHMRFGQLVGVHDGGRLYRIPILDRVVLIDKGLRPLPALRHVVKSANGSGISYEAVITYAVIDPEKYWTRFHGADAEAAQLVSQTREAATASAIAARGDGQLASPDDRAALAAAIVATVNANLAPHGLALRQLRFVGLRLVQ